MNIWLLHGHAIIVRRVFRAEAGHCASRLRQTAEMFDSIPLFFKLLFLLLEGFEDALRTSFTTGSGKASINCVLFKLRFLFNAVLVLFMLCSQF